MEEKEEGRQDIEDTLTPIKQLKQLRYRRGEPHPYFELHLPTRIKRLCRRWPTRQFVDRASLIPYWIRIPCGRHFEGLAIGPSEKGSLETADQMERPDRPERQ